MKAGYLPKRLVEYQLRSQLDRIWLAVMFMTHSRRNILTSKANASRHVILPTKVNSNYFLLSVILMFHLYFTAG